MYIYAWYPVQCSSDVLPASCFNKAGWHVHEEIRHLPQEICPSYPSSPRRVACVLFPHACTEVFAGMGVLTWAGSSGTVDRSILKLLSIVIVPAPFYNRIYTDREP